MKAGYKGCAAPNCCSKVGEGKIFRRFPSDRDLAAAWSQHLPASFKVFSSTAFCENHFDADQFERPRADGSKKLKQRAVPTVFNQVPLCETPKHTCNAKRIQSMQERAPFTDITNNSVQETPKRPSIAQPSQIFRTMQQTELDAAQSLLSLCSEPKPIAAECTLTVACVGLPEVELPQPTLNDQPIDSIALGDKLDTTSPKHHSNARRIHIVKKRVPLSNISNLVEETPKCVPTDSTFLDDKLGTLRMMSPEVPEVPEVPAIIGPNGFLNEITGHFTPGLSSDINPQDLSPPIASPLPLIDPNLSVDDFINQEDLTIEKAIQYIRHQEKKLDGMHFKVEQQKERIDSFEEEMAVKGKFELKYLALQKRHARLEADYKRSTYSPYLTPNQFKRITRGTNRGIIWTPDEIRQGLVLKLHGTKGYHSFAKQFHLIPSVRVLQSRVQFIQFKPGLLHEVFDLIHTFAKDLQDHEEDCQIVMDEMQLKNYSKYDRVLDRYIGQCTLAGHTGKASKALLVLLAGISKRWKISVAVEFTSKKSPEEWRNTTGEAYCDLLTKVTQRAEEAGVRVCGITTDMGSDNLSFWNHFRLTGSKYAKLMHTVPNPARPEDPMFVLPDIVHLFKNAKKMLESNKFLKLPQKLLDEEGLESPFVHYRHLDEAIEFEKEAELKVAYRLSPQNLHCQKHFSSMNVGTAKAVICQRSSAILKVMSRETCNRSYLTTAYFIETLNAFFDLATCRHIGLAVTKSKPAAYKKAIDLIKKVSFMFCNMEVGDGEWKPVQRGFKVLCASYLGLIDYFLEKRKFSHLMLGRFSSDCIENVFSLIRLMQTVPDAATFLQNLKVITLAQFSEAVRGSSYEYDECEQFEEYDFLEEARQRALQRKSLNDNAAMNELNQSQFKKPSHSDYARLGHLEKQVLYDVAGSVVKTVIKNRKVCTDCIKSVKWKRKRDADIHPMADVSIMKEYSVLRTGDNEAKKRLLQIYVSDTVFQATLTAEVAFRMNRDNAMKFQHAKVKQFFVSNLMYIWEDCDVLKCHNICQKILSVFIGKRLLQYGKILREEDKENQIQFGSKSVAANQLAANVGKRKGGVVGGGSVKRRKVDANIVGIRKVDSNRAECSKMR